jgi:hypothetical protein
LEQCHLRLTFAEPKPTSRISAGRQQYQALSVLYTPANNIPSSAPTTPNPGDLWDGNWFVDEGSVVVRVGAGDKKDVCCAGIKRIHRKAREGHKDNVVSASRPLRSFR